MRHPLFVTVVFMSCLNLSVACFKSFDNENQPAPLVLVEPAEELKPDLPKTPEPEPEPEEPKLESKIEFIDVPKFRTQSEDSIYGDIMSHSKDAPFGDRHGRATNAHETGHGIHAYIRNTHRQSGMQINGFYVLDGKGVIIEEPNMRKNHIAQFVPEVLRFGRFNLYLINMTEWDDRPLYIYDEWNAYILGAACNVDDVNRGKYSDEWTDGVAGCLEFSFYAMALCMAVEKNDPEYWRSNTQFRNYTIWTLKRSKELYDAGSKMKEFKWEKQDRLLQSFRTDPSVEPMRKFVKENLEGVWLD